MDLNTIEQELLKRDFIKHSNFKNVWQNEVHSIWIELGGLYDKKNDFYMSFILSREMDGVEFMSVSCCGDMTTSSNEYFLELLDKQIKLHKKYYNKFFKFAKAYEQESLKLIDDFSNKLK